MVERIIIDSKYTYEYSDGKVALLRHGEKWITDPTGSKAWIAAAGEIERLRAERDEARKRVKATEEEVRRERIIERLTAEAARENLARAERAEAEVKRLLAERTAAHADNATCASCTHEYVADLEKRLEEAEGGEIIE